MSEQRYQATGLTREQAKEVADLLSGGTAMWGDGKAYPSADCVVEAMPSPPPLPVLSEFDLAFEILRLMDSKKIDVLQSCHFGYVLRVERERYEPDAPQPPGYALDLCYLYWSAYHAGHHDTVEGQYTDVLPVDRFDYWKDRVDECLQSGDMEALRPAATNGVSMEGEPTGDPHPADMSIDELDRYLANEPAATPGDARICPHCDLSLIECYDARAKGCIKCCPDCDHRTAKPAATLEQPSEWPAYAPQVADVGTAATPGEPAWMKRCEWEEIEDGSGIYNTCKDGEEFHLTEGLELYPHCHWCGGEIVVMSSSTKGVIR